MNKHIGPSYPSVYVSNLEDAVLELEKTCTATKDALQIATARVVELENLNQIMVMDSLDWWSRAEMCFRALTALRDDYGLTCESANGEQHLDTEGNGGWWPEECPLCKARKAIETIGNLFDKPHGP
jgi:hypothetical protein